MARRELGCVAFDSAEGLDVHSLPNPELVEQFSPTSTSSLSESSSSESSSTSISRPVHTEAVSVSLWPTLPADVSNILVNAGFDRPELLGLAFENEDELDAFIPDVDKTFFRRCGPRLCVLLTWECGERPVSCVNSSR